MHVQMCQCSAHRWIQAGVSGVAAENGHKHVFLDSLQNAPLILEVLSCLLFLSEHRLTDMVSDFDLVAFRFHQVQHFWKR